MDNIKICDLEVYYHVGVPDEERARPQRLLLTIEMTSDFSSAIHSDQVKKTIDYHDVCVGLINFGEGRSWHLIEKLGDDLAKEILRQFKPKTVTVQVKKFIIPQARYVSVTIKRPR